MAALDGERFDCVVIGAGMSGLAAGIRLAMFDQRTLVVERHNVAGGLNSFYSFDGRKYDVGLHALTNFAPARARGRPLTKLLRQLRLSWEDLDLAEQCGSRIAIPGCDLRFTNDFALLESEVARAFPAQADGFRSLAQAVRETDETALDVEAVSARSVMGLHLSDPVLVDMLLVPLMFYGSAREHDMDWPQFCILFKALFFEGFARPFEGVRRIVRLLNQRFKEVGGVRQMKCGVCQVVDAGDGLRVELETGETVYAGQVLSSVGKVETERLLRGGSDLPGEADKADEAEVGRLSFVETITITRSQPAAFGWDETIVFFNDSERFHYERPDGLVDPRSGVICLPNNYRYSDGRTLPEGVFRLTALASYPGWTALPEEAYQAAKAHWFELLQRKARSFLPPVDNARLTDETVTTDMFTPRTIEKYTGHLGGAVYGAPEKARRGETSNGKVHLIGTDQGFLGITGAMLSGITIANLKVLSASV
ncbi:MAG: phytoene desaturase family protein [Opitutales bacterium]